VLLVEATIQVTSRKDRVKTNRENAYDDDDMAATEAASSINAPSIPGGIAISNNHDAG
jgi:hypothetical protein